MNNICAAIILYDGKPISESTMVNIKRVLVAQGALESMESTLNVTIMDAESIADAIFQKEHVDKMEVVPLHANREPVIAALTQIGKKFSTVIEECRIMKNYSKFAVTLAFTCVVDEDIRKHVVVIGKANARFTAEELRRYGITAGALSAIKDVYGSMG